jgi:hypothetical protein
MKMTERSALFLLLCQVLPACGEEFDHGNDAEAGSAGAAGAVSTGMGGRGGASSQDAGGTGGSSATGGASGAASFAHDSAVADVAEPHADAGLADGTPRDAPSDARDADVDALRDTGSADAGRPDTGIVDIVGSVDKAIFDIVPPDLATPDAACRQAPVVLGAADNFVVLAGSTVTNDGPTSLTGDLGVSPGTAVTGFPPGTIVGMQHAGDSAAAQGEADLTTAYNDAAGRTLCPITIAGNLGGQTLTPGLYHSTSSLEISSGDLTLDAQGDANAVFIFQMASTLMTTSGRQVFLIGSAKSSHVFWQVGTSVTLGSTSAFQGTIMADQAITLATGATLNGRALARVAAVALDSNTIVKPTP